MFGRVAVDAPIAVALVGERAWRDARRRRRAALRRPLLDPAAPNVEDLDLVASVLGEAA